MVNTINESYAHFDDVQLVNMTQNGDFDALSELWIRHVDFIKKVTLNQYYKIRPDFSEDFLNSEKLWSYRLGSSYINLAKAAETYDSNYSVPFLAYFAMKNKYAFKDEKAFNTEMSMRNSYCENYDSYEFRDQDDDMAEIVNSIEKCLSGNERLRAFFKKYVETFDELGYVSQTDMAKIMGISRQMINTNFKKIRFIAEENGLEKEFADFLSAQDEAQNYIQKPYSSECYS